MNRRKELRPEGKRYGGPEYRLERRPGAELKRSSAAKPLVPLYPKPREDKGAFDPSSLRAPHQGVYSSKDAKALDEISDFKSWLEQALQIKDWQSWRKLPKAERRNHASHRRSLRT